jgi:phytoene dehydrogenase-like protein
MSTTERYDALIIGAGLGGLITGAILAKLEGMKVLILEREDVIGGRIFTFEHYDGDEKTFLRRLWDNSRSRFVTSKPGMVGNRRMPVKSPIVENLYFTGDSTEQWSFGQSGTTGGAVNCASAVTGKDQSVLLPFYMR